MGQSFRFYVHAHAVGCFRDKETLRAETLRPIAATGDEIFAGMKEAFWVLKRRRGWRRGSKLSLSAHFENKVRTRDGAGGVIISSAQTSESGDAQCSVFESEG